MSKLPLVSVVAVCYNHAAYLVETLDSILAQSYEPIQLIIMDDCSSDNSVELIQEWIQKNKQEDCTFIAHKENQGLCKTLNEALNYIEGEYFQLIACDDILVEQKIELNVKCFLSNSQDLVVVHSDMIGIDESSQELFPSYHQKYDYKEPEEGAFFKALLKAPMVAAPSALLKTAAVREVGGYDENLFYEDWAMWLKLGEKYRFIRIDKPLVKYRVLASSMSRSREGQIKSCKATITFLQSWKGVHQDYDVIINRTISNYIERLIHLDEANTKELRMKWQIDKTGYSFFIYILSLIGISSKSADRWKNKIKGIIKRK